MAKGIRKIMDGIPFNNTAGVCADTQSASLTDKNLSGGSSGSAQES
jgi:hypothetical protein